MSFDDENDVKEEKKERKRNLTKACLINYSIKSLVFFVLFCCRKDAHRNLNRCVAA